MTFHQFEKLNGERDFQSKIILDALTELSSLEVILLTQNNALRCNNIPAWEEVGLCFSLENEKPLKFETVWL